MNGEQIPVDDLLKIIGELYLQVRMMQKEIEKLRMAQQKQENKKQS